jgi:hypothetical protein
LGAHAQCQFQYMCRDANTSAIGYWLSAIPETGGCRFEPLPGAKKGSPLAVRRSRLGAQSRRRSPYMCRDARSGYTDDDDCHSPGGESIVVIPKLGFGLILTQRFNGQ